MIPTLDYSEGAALSSDGAPTRSLLSPERGYLNQISSESPSSNSLLSTERLESTEARLVAYAQKHYMIPPIKAESRITNDGFLVAQQWEGEVIALTDTCMTAKLTDVTNEANPTEIVELPIAKVHSEDKDLVQLGGIFYLSVGCKSEMGCVRNTFLLRFRRFPVWTNRKVRLLKEKARILFEELSGHGQANPTRA